jgi:phosphatidylglycerophosphate synthase
LVNVNHKIKANYVTFFNIFLLFFILTFSVCSYIYYYFYWVFIAQLFLFYFTLILDKVDGEIARYHSFLSKKGVYIDLIYHLIYPTILFLVISIFFFSKYDNFLFFIFTIVTGLLITVFKNLKFVKNYINKSGHIGFDNFSDIQKNKSEQKEKRPILPFRIIFYLSFMVYDWVLLFYFLLTIFSIIFGEIAYFIYIFHITVTFFIIFIYVFYIFPKERLFRP